MLTAASGNPEQNNRSFGFAGSLQETRVEIRNEQMSHCLCAAIAPLLAAVYERDAACAGILCAWVP
jgi:hypothetical protein